MDVIKQKEKKGAATFSPKLISSVLVLLLMLLIAYIMTSGQAVSVHRDDIIIAPVKRGDLQVTIEGYGILASEKQQVITAPAVATVKEILVKPGAQVISNSIIVKLDSPELLLELETARQELELAEAAYRQLKVDQKREALTDSANLVNIKAEYNIAVLKRKAQEKIVKIGIVSRLAYEEMLLTEQQLQERVALFTQQVEQLKDIHEEALNIEQAKVKQKQRSFELAQQRVDKLTVRAGFDGVLQKLSIELGQSLTVGQEFAQIGSVKKLVALVNVPQSQASLVAIGQRAIIDNRRDKIQGSVVRIDPIVKDNTVIVEVALNGELPQSARPYANVDAVIIADTLNNVNYIERPGNVRADSEVSIYRLSDDLNEAQLKTIRVGKKAGRYIEIVSEVSVGEHYIVSDMSNLAGNVPQLTIVP